jgi:hypothetical protein
VQMKAASIPTTSYFVLLALSALIATFGLLANIQCTSPSACCRAARVSGGSAAGAGLCMAVGTRGSLAALVPWLRRGTGSCRLRRQRHRWTGSARGANHKARGETTAAEPGFGGHWATRSAHARAAEPRRRHAEAEPRHERRFGRAPDLGRNRTRVPARSRKGPRCRSTGIRRRDSPASR